MKDAKLRFREAAALDGLAKRLEAALRQAARALLDEKVSREDFASHIGTIRAATEGIESSVAALEKLFAL